MKQTIVVLLILGSILGCKQEKVRFTMKDLQGEWFLYDVSYSSSCVNNCKEQHLLVDDKGNYFIFSQSNGGGLIDHGSVVEDTILNRFYGKLVWKLRDSTQLELDNYVNDSYNSDYPEYYMKNYAENYKERLESYLENDSLRSLALGWWKLIKARDSVKLISYPEKCKEFTLHIGNDGKTTFFKEHCLDSSVTYGYEMNGEGIEFKIRDIPSEWTTLSFESDTIMKLLMTPSSSDTLVLRKLKFIK